MLVDREKEFKNSLQQIGSEMKLLSAEAKKLQAQYAEEANTYDALAAKSKNLGAQYDELTKELETQKKALENQRELKKQYEAQTESLAKKAEEAAAAYNNAAEKTEGLKKAMREAKDAVNQNAQNIEKAESRAKTYTRQITETETAQMLLGRELDKTNMYLQEAATSADGTARSIDKYGNEVKGAAEGTKSFANAADLLAQAIVASGAIEGAEKLRDAIIATAKASIEYESAFAGVKKTVDGTAEELEALSGGLRNMSLEIPIAATELAGIAESAGQLGIETGNILGFTEVMAQLGVTTNLSANEAATALAKFANITKMSESEYSNLGSSIVALGNNFATTEADIVAMATRLASTGEVVGLTEPQILAVATALSSVGIEAEAGGSAFSKLLRYVETSVQLYNNAAEAISKTGYSVRELELMFANNSKNFKSLADSVGLTSTELKNYVGVVKDVDQYATVAGTSVEQFMSAWNKDSVSTLSQFIDGLGRMERQGESVTVVLDKMGLTEVRLNNAIQALAASDGILTETLKLSSSAWEENTALAEEAAVRFETTESKLQLLSNAFENLKITVGDELVGQFGGAIDGLTELTMSAEDFIQKNPEVVSGLTAVAAGLGSLAVAGTVTPLISTLFTTIANNPIAIAIASVTTLAASFGTLALEASGTISAFKNQASAAGELIEKGNGLKTTFAETYKEIRTESESLETAIGKIETLGGKTDLTKQETVLLQGAMNKLNGAIPGLALSYDDLGDSLDATIIKLKLLTEISGKTAESTAIESQIQAQQAYREELNTSISATTEELEKARKYLADISEGGIKTFKDGSFDLIGTIQDNVNLAANTMLGYVGDADTAVKDLEKKLDGLRNELGSTDLNIDDLSKNKAEIDEYIADASAKAEEALNSLKGTTRETYTTVSETVEGTADKVVESNTKIATSTKATKEATDEAGKAIIEHAKTVKSNLEALSKEYDSVYKSAQSSLGGIGGLFGEIAFKTDKSISDMLSGLDSQADYFTGYMLNLQRAAQIGIDDGLVAALADGSDESAGYLQMIVNEFNKVAEKYGESSQEAEDFVNDFNSKFEATSKAKDALAGTIAGIQTNFEERAQDILADAESLVDELSGYGGNAYGEVATAVSETLTAIADGFGQFQIAAQEKSQGIIDAALYIKQGINTTLEVLPEEMKVAGQNVSLGLSEGILEKAGELEDTVRRLAKEAIIGAAKDELGIHSPSEEGREIGKFFDEGIAQGIERNKSTVLSANLDMIQKLEAQSQSAAAAAGRSLGNTMAKSMAEALRAGQALRQQVESGKLTVDGKVVQTAASVGIPSLTGQAAIDFNNEMKDFHNLPSDWSNQDIVDWLNGGGFHGGTSSSTQAAIDSALKNESAGKVSLTQTTNKAWHDSYVNQLNANNSKSGSSGTTVVVNQTITGTTSYYDAKQGAKAGVQEATYY